MILPTVGVTIWAIIKIFIIILLSLYIIFAFVIIRQVQLMTTTLEVGFESALKFLAFAHFICAIVVLIFSILIL